MATKVLGLEEHFHVFDLAEKARDAASTIGVENAIPLVEQAILRTLNAGLSNVVGGYLAVTEPQQAKAVTDVQAWQEFAWDIAFAFDRLINENCTVFHQESLVADELAQSSEADLLPEYLKDAIDWQKVVSNLSHTFVSMDIDGQTYVSGVGLA